MKLAVPRLAIAPAIVLTVLAAGCSSGGTPTSDPTPEPMATPTSAPAETSDSGNNQRVVYVSPEFFVFTINRDGTERRRVAGEGDAAISGGVQARPIVSPGTQRFPTVYTWPTWSPDGSRVALSRSPGTEEQSVASLILLNQGDPAEITLHTTQRGFVELVAEGAFHYTQWSPDSEHLSVVAPQKGGDRLALFDVALDGGEPFEVSADAPLYHVWSPDGTRILIHRRESLLLHDVRTRETVDLDRPSARYRVPAFSPDGEEIAFVASGDGSEHLLARNLASKQERSLWTVRTHASFAWSPVDADLMAAAQRITTGTFRHDGIELIDTRTGKTRSLFNGAVTAFYWSPDGTKIAVLVDGPRRNSFAWIVIEVDSGDVTNLTPFTSSARYLTNLEFFDQFAPSHSPWSADSSALVMAGGITPRPAGLSRIWVLDASGETEPQAIAEGRLAFWGPPGDWQ